MGLRLEGMGLAGVIDVDALLEIKSLRIISFVNNSFTGSIPEFNRLPALKAMYLTGNRFAGEIAADYFAKMDSLKKIWLSKNDFTGNIPASLSRLPHLIELHLENNKFSGRIPDLNSETLKEFDLANNKLEGEIPPNLARFNANSFAGNTGLCGEPVGVKCDEKPGKHPGGGEPIEDEADKHDKLKIIGVCVTLGIMLLCLLIFFLLRWKKKEQGDKNVKQVPKERQIPMETIEVNVSVPSSKKGRQLSKRRSGSVRKGSQKGGGMGELVMVNTEKGVFGLPDLMKAAAEVLGNGGVGCSYKATMANGVTVVVKRMREINAIGKEAFDTDVRKLGELRHPNILAPLAYHFRKDEKLFVYEYIPKGSLLYRLHGDRGPAFSEFDWNARLKTIKGITRGLDYLYTELAFLEAPHGNLKSSNVLIGTDHEPLLSEYGFCSFMNQNSQVLFACKSPEALETGNVTAKSDVYCLGIIILEVLTGEFPCQYLITGKGGADLISWVESAIAEGKPAELFDPVICTAGTTSGMEELLNIGVACIERDPEKRLDMQEAIKRIQGIKIEGQPDTKMEMLPTPKDGFSM